MQTPGTTPDATPSPAAAAPGPLAALRARLAPLDARLGRGAEAGLVALALAVLGLLAWREALRQTYPYFDDVTYLWLGHQVRDLGGPLGLLRALFSGAWEESNRHPLYLALLGLIARVDPRYHRDAQALNVGLAALALLSCWWTARRHLGRSAAATLALLLATSRIFVACAAREGCEPLLVAVWAQAIGALLDGLEPGRPRPLAAWARAGLWSGLAYLTKGTGMFLPVGLALAFLLHERLRAVRDRRAWTYAGAFLLAASPLVVRNLLRFGAPFYNGNLPTLWQDRLPDFAESFAPQARAALPRGFLDYLHHLTPGALAERVGTGLGETAFLLGDAMAPAGGAADRPLALGVYVAGALLGAAATALAVRLLVRHTAGFLRTILLVHAGFSFLFLFVFSVNGGNTRYFLPLAATVLLPALAAGVASGAARAAAPLRARAVRLAGGVALAAVLLALTVHGPVLRQPGMEGVRDWLAAHLRPGDTYAVDARTHLQLQWVAPRAEQLIVSAAWHERPVEAEILLDHLRAHRVRWVVLDGGAVANLARPGDPAGRRYLFYDRMPLQPDGSLPLTGVPDGLRVAYADPGAPRRWLVLETPWGAGAP